MVPLDDDNKLQLQIVIKNTDTIESRFIFKIENCDDGPVIIPSKEISKSITPKKPAFITMAIDTATSKPADYNCTAVLYDSQLNKLD